MEDIKFQYRPLQEATNTSHYPLTFDQRITQGDRYREAAEQLNANIRNIESFYSSSNSGAHNGSPDCDRCSTKKRRVMQAYYDYYLGNQPGRWDERLIEYRHGIENMFNMPDVPLDAIHARYKTELREHLRKDLCTSLPYDSKDVLDHKSRIDEILQQIPLEKALEQGFQAMVDLLALPPALDGRGGLHDLGYPVGFNIGLQDCRNVEQRAGLYIAYYCAPTWNDTPQQRNMKTKYSKIFESGMSHDIVLEMWKKEARETKSREVDRLKQRLGELQMAQSAHRKNKARKMEKDAMMKDKEYVVVPRLVECSLRGCDVQMDLSREGPVECAVCDWLARRDRHRRRFYYCSEDHVEDDFDEHDRHEHACIMGNHCYYYPMTGPPGQTGACGICPDCIDSDVVSFFCSHECYMHNVDAHRDEIHYSRGIASTADQLDNFQPETDLEITTL